MHSITDSISASGFGSEKTLRDADSSEPLYADERYFFADVFIQMWRFLTLMLVLSRLHIYALLRRGQSRGRVSEPALFEAHSAIASD